MRANDEEKWQKYEFVCENKKLSTLNNVWYILHIHYITSAFWAHERAWILKNHWSCGLLYIQLVSNKASKCSASLLLQWIECSAWHELLFCLIRASVVFTFFTFWIKIMYNPAYLNHYSIPCEIFFLLGEYHSLLCGLLIHIRKQTIHIKLYFKFCKEVIKIKQRKHRYWFLICRTPMNTYIEA